jgi:hypothetical protein
VLASDIATATCVAGPTNWDTIGSVCADPQVSASIPNDYFTPANFDFTCSGSKSWELYNSDLNTLVSSGASALLTFSKSILLPAVQGNYQVHCKHGSVEATQTVFYHYPANQPIVIIDAYPKTLSTAGTSLVNWNITFPIAACTLTATAVCTNNVCTQSQTDAAEAINRTIATENTDLNDPNTSRPIPSTVNDFAPGHKTTDHRALGRKTFGISKTTDFTVDCGSGKKATTRIRVANSNEG